METNAFDDFYSAPGTPGAVEPPRPAPPSASPLDPAWRPAGPDAPSVPGAGLAPLAPAVQPLVASVQPLSPAPAPVPAQLQPQPAAVLAPAPAASPLSAVATAAPLTAAAPPAVPASAVAAPSAVAASHTSMQEQPVREPAGQARTALGETNEMHEGPVLADLLIAMLEVGASDLHLTAGARPSVRKNGHLQPLEDYPELNPSLIQRILYTVLTQKQREKFEEELELDFAYSLPGRARFRVNLYRQRDAVGAALRLIPYEIKKLEDLGIPPSVSNFSMLPRGLVLVTGPTGSGKSTTLASLVDLANRQRHDHIMTVEDPIEFLHSHKNCLVNQREVGEDTKSFGNALRHALRQDPDIILVGELRDLETISVAVTAAETGHLVYATLHTSDAAQTIDRIIDVFPPHQQQQVRVQLAGALQGVVCQTLARTTDGNGRVVATEVLVATPAIRNLIREGKTHQIYSSMQAGAKHGMHTLDQHLADLVKQHRITYETGLEKAHHIEDFQRLCGRG